MVTDPPNILKFESGKKRFSGKPELLAHLCRGGRSQHYGHRTKLTYFHWVMWIQGLFAAYTDPCKTHGLFEYSFCKPLNSQDMERVL